MQKGDGVGSGAVDGIFACGERWRSGGCTTAQAAIPAFLPRVARYVLVCACCCCAPRPGHKPAARPHLRGVASGGSGTLAHDAHASGGHGAGALVGGGASGPGGAIPGRTRHPAGGQLSWQPAGASARDVCHCLVKQSARVQPDTRWFRAAVTAALDEHSRACTPQPLPSTKAPAHG